MRGLRLPFLCLVATLGCQKPEAQGGDAQAAPSAATIAAATTSVAPSAPPPPMRKYPSLPAVASIAPHAPPTGPCAALAAKCPKCTLPLLQQTCMAAVASGDPRSCQQGLSDKDVESNCR